jgi:hypothetical protein
MKLLLLSPLCVFSIAAFAQINEIPERNLTDSFKQNDVNDNLRKQLQNYLQQKQFQNDHLSQEGKIISLPQDNMPCIIAGTKNIAPIPNAWSGVTVPYRPQHHPIPNPALAPRSIKFSVADSWEQSKKK